ncbi:hypothetical protein RKE29_01485 [Streptomyces sp. B1866]|uniref:hypothetical protein n=1 Tax=Streptomyces sp. B1866 TaxID=3075431 RepID=UPI00288F441C|nr:hypothetical protein [Streptomyces sp. B1866]MDT3395332.1 hypothetical protein [Streptomyces sp. B1866]
MSEPVITIVMEPSGRVSARGADTLAATLLRRAGFTEVYDWHGLRHRLPSTTPVGEQAAVAGYATRMLRAARYPVEVDPALDPDTPDTPTVPTSTDPHGHYRTGRAVLALTDQLNAATTPGQAAAVLDQLLNPTDGVLVRLQEAVEAAAEKCGEFDDDGNSFPLSDQLAAAAEQLTETGDDLDGAVGHLRALGTAPPPAPSRAIASRAVTDAARATSPATTATTTALAPAVGSRTTSAPATTTGAPHARRTR